MIATLRELACEPDALEPEVPEFELLPQPTTTSVVANTTAPPSNLLLLIHI
jgi:hypothetical protein